MPSETDIEPPTLYELSQLAKDHGLVGEEATMLSVFVITLNGGLVIVTGPSRSGKDEIVDAVEYCRSGFDVAKIPNSTSPTVLYQRANEFNNARVHRYPDITNLDDHLETLLKQNGDGRPSKHSYTDVENGRESVTQTIEPPNSMILFLASDNQKVDIDDFPEVRNRAMVVSTDASADLTQRITKRQARVEVGRYEQKVTNERAEKVRRYVSNIPLTLYTDDSDPGEVWNLTHLGFRQENPLPSIFPESRMDFDRFNRFVKSVTMFHYGNRMQIHTPSKDDTTVGLLSTPEDLWLSWRIFGEKMVLSSLNLTEIDFAILNLLRTRAQALEVSEVMTEMRKQGYNLSDQQARGALESMLGKGYVFKDTSGTLVKYSPSPFATQDNISRDISIDFETVVEQTKADARNALEPDVADEYIARFCEGDGLVTQHPINGEEVHIVETDLLDEVSERIEEESDTIDESNPFGDDGTQDEPEPEPDGDESGDGQETFSGTL